jgi:hypothetical protein
VRVNDSGVLLFVGNWRSVFRRAVWAVVPTVHDLGLYGQGRRYLAPEHARPEHVPNEQLHGLYSSADIVLADHWDHMRHHGFVSNRTCDALACGAFVLCDDFPALHDLFAEGLETFATREDLRAKVERYPRRPRGQGRRRAAWAPPRARESHRRPARRGAPGAPQRARCDDSFVPADAE